MKKYISPIFWGLCFVIFTILVKTYDVQPLGAEGSLIGFANLNTSVYTMLGENHFCYMATQIFGILALMVAALFAAAGLIQLIRRKNLFKVDRQILMAGIIYLIVILLYILFEKVPVNYRPVVFDEGLEPSYPSTHTMLILTIFGTAMSAAGLYIKSAKLAFWAKVLCLVIIELTIVFRLLSGVHWFTDIIGGLLISICLISLYKKLIITEEK